jgi:hypothetical protein
MAAAVAQICSLPNRGFSICRALVYIKAFELPDAMPDAIRRHPVNPGRFIIVGSPVTRRISRRSNPPECWLQSSNSMRHRCITTQTAVSNRFFNAKTSRGRLEYFAHK